MQINLDKIAADRAAGTDGPWVYRPHKYDDWGMVRGGDDYPVAAVSICRASNEDLNQHRVEGTDPAYYDANLIAQAPAMADALIAINAAVEKAEAGDTHPVEALSQIRALLKGEA